MKDIIGYSKKRHIFSEHVCHQSLFALESLSCLSVQWDLEGLRTLRQRCILFSVYVLKPLEFFFNIFGGGASRGVCVKVEEKQKHVSLFTLCPQETVD